MSSSSVGQGAPPQQPRGYNQRDPKNPLVQAEDINQRLQEAKTIEEFKAIWDDPKRAEADRALDKMTRELLESYEANEKDPTATDRSAQPKQTDEAEELDL